MIGLRFHFAEYHYVGPEVLVDANRQDGMVEIVGLQISLHCPTKESVGSFYLAVVQRRKELFTLPKMVPTTECFEFEGPIVEERHDVVYGEVLRQWSLRAGDAEFYLHANKLGSSSVRLVVFESLEKDRLHTLTRVKGAAEFTRRFAPYSMMQVSWMTRFRDSTGGDKPGDSTG